MNVKLYKKHSMQSAIALSGHHCDYMSCISCITHICYIMICHYYRPIALVINVLCFIDQTNVK